MSVTEGYVAQEDNIQNFFLHFLDVEPIQRKKFRVTEFLLRLLNSFCHFLLTCPIPENTLCPQDALSSSIHHLPRTIMSSLYFIFPSLFPK